MSYLVDTNAWIFLFQSDSRLSETALKILEDSESNLQVSVASLWEASIKVGIGKLKFPPSVQKSLLEVMSEYRIEILTISPQAALAVKDLPSIHGDPFDRIQVCQAKEHGLEMISSDPVFEKYGIKRWW